MVFLFSTKCFLFVYMYIDLLKLKAYKLFENSDADLSWLLFFKEANMLKPLWGNAFSKNRVKSKFCLLQTTGPFPIIFLLTKIKMGKRGGGALFCFVFLSRVQF